jgi:hypothetical protein
MTQDILAGAQLFAAAHGSLRMLRPARGLIVGR